MPVCYITLSEKSPTLSSKQLDKIRYFVAKGLDSKSRKLDQTHISIRVQKSERSCMLSDIEIDIFAQLYLRRLLSRDKRANMISRYISNYLHCGCATWINMSYVGYSRVNNAGDIFYSDSDNVLIRTIQRLRGISTKDQRSVNNLSLHRFFSF